MTEQIDYGYEPLRGIPEAMQPWNLKLELPYPSEFGEYVLIEVDQADIELHHQVEVIDESGEPIRGVWVVFGFPGGGPDPLFGRLFGIAISINYLPAALGGSTVELIVLALLIRPDVLFRRCGRLAANHR